MGTGPWEPLGPWQGEPRALMLAPMAGVTDLPFRLLARECGASLAITEFTNSTALTREATTSWRRMETHAMEDPFIPQIFGGDLDDMVTAAGLLEPQADIIDLNFGCPAPKVTRVCAGAALMGHPDMLLDIWTESVLGWFCWRRNFRLSTAAWMPCIWATARPVHRSKRGSSRKS